MRHKLTTYFVFAAVAIAVAAILLFGVVRAL